MAFQDLRTCTLEQFGAVGDGTTDDSAAWNAAIAALNASTYRVLSLGARTYRVESSTTLTAADASIVGLGYASCLTTTSDIKVVHVTGERCLVYGFRIQGDNGTSAQVGVQVGTSAGTCPSRVIVSNVHTNAMYRGFFAVGGSSMQYGGGCFLNCTSEDANIHFATAEAAEYWRIDSCQGWGSLVAVRSPGSGCDVGAGNTIVTNSSFTYNVYGGRLLVATNDAHGTFVGCHLNHNGSPLYADAIANGHTIVGCHIYGGELWLNGCTGVRFVDCMGHLDAGSGFLANSAVDCQIINWRFTAATAFSIDSTSSVTPERCYGDATAVKNLNAYVRKAYTMADSNQTLSAQDSCASTVVVSGTLTATRDLTISRTPRRHTVGHGAMLVINTTTQTINAGWSSGTKVAVAAGAKVFVGDDGTNAFAEAA